MICFSVNNEHLQSTTTFKSKNTPDGLMLFENGVTASEQLNSLATTGHVVEVSSQNTTNLPSW